MFSRFKKLQFNLYLLMWVFLIIQLNMFITYSLKNILVDKIFLILNQIFNIILQLENLEYIKYMYICNYFNYFNQECILNNFTKELFIEDIDIFYQNITKNLFLLLLFMYVLTLVFIIPYVNSLSIYGVFYSSIIPLCFFNLIFFFSSIFLKINDISINIILFDKLFILDKLDSIPLSFKIDYIATSFANLTLNIGFFSILYSFSYFRDEPHIHKLILLIHFFILSMLLFVFSSNLICLFLGWEFIGLTSFLLINFWIHKSGVLKASFKAFFFNKWSDLFIILFIILLYLQYGSFEINQILTELWITKTNNPDFIKYTNFITDYYNTLFYNKKKKKEFTSSNYILNISEFTLLFFILGSSIKSAQFFFHLWLPDSMEAPVPASALIHSATLVSAGIYLMIRFGGFLHITSVASSTIISLWGAITALYGGISACNQNDIKKILAYSTISHCGNMFLLASIGLYDLTIIYLNVHGYFKAISFFSAGNIIRVAKNSQDIRKIGMTAYYTPLDTLILTISLLNLGGLPLTLGFYLKHYLLMFTSIKKIDFIIISLCLIGTAITGLLYMLKIIFHVFFDFKKGDLNIYFKKEKNNLISKFYSSTSNTLIPLLLLSLINTYLHSFFLILVDNSDLTSSGEKFERKVLINKNINSNWLSEIEFLLSYKELLIFSLLLFIEYNYKVNWRFTVTEKKGNFIFYLVVFSFSFIFNNFLNISNFFNSTIINIYNINIKFYWIEFYTKYIIFIVIGGLFKNTKFINTNTLYYNKKIM